MHSSSASFAVGLNCPVSMELIVLRETPTMSANCDCDSPCADGTGAVAVGPLRLRQPLCRPHLPQAIAQRQALVFLPHTPRTTLTTYAASAAAAAIVVSMANTRSDFFRVKAKRG